MTGAEELHGPAAPPAPFGAPPAPPTPPAPPRADVQPWITKVHRDEHPSVPAANAFIVTEAQVSPLRLLPSQSSPYSSTPLPHTVTGGPDSGSGCATDASAQLHADQDPARHVVVPRAPFEQLQAIWVDSARRPPSN